ncbi:MAG: DUF7619 domain-containing protein [Aureispira sp.]
MKIAKRLICLTVLLCCWSATTLLGQCPNGYQIFTSQQPSCATATDGVIRAQGTTYYSAATFLWNTGATSRYLYNVAPGYYSVTVTDPTTCVYNVQSYYLAPNPRGPRININYNACTRQISAYGQSSLSLSWNTGSTANILTNVTPGVYTVTGTTTSGCVGQSSITIGPNQTPLLAASHTVTAATCNGNNGSVDLTVTGGVAPYTYSWRQSGWTTVSNLQDPSNLQAGAARVYIRDANNCGIWYDVVIPGPTASVDFSNTSCGMNNAFATVNTAGFTNPSITWSNGATTPTINNLSAGTYTVSVAGGGCTLSETITVGTGGALTAVIYDSTNNCQDIRISAYGNGGAGWNAGYTFLWNTGATTDVISVQQGGTYSVIVTDANGCTAFDTIHNVNSMPYVTTSAAITDATCGNSDGAIDLTVNGGYQGLIWSPTGATTEDITNIAAGFHVVTLYGYNNCSRNDTFAVGEFITYSTTDASCGLSNGSASVTTHNMANPVYSWSNGATTASINNVAAGTYTVTVTNNGCTVVETIVINDAGTLVANIQPTSACQPDFLDAAPMDGASPYTFLWSDGSTNQSLANPVVGNTYSVVITDANGCTDNASYMVPNFPTLNATHTTVDATCGNKNGIASLQVTGGAAPYSYQWSTGTGNVATQNSLYAGQYAAVVTDNNGCEVEVSPIIVGGQIAVIVQAAVTPITTGNTGSINITVTGATNPTYLWSNGATTEDIANLGAGHYRVYITDAATGCTLERTYYLANGGTLGANVSLISGYVRDVSATNACNNNGLRLANRMVRLQPSGQIAFTDYRGRYRFYVATAGNYTVEYVNNNPTTSILCPTGGTIAVNGVTLGLSYSNQNFYLTRPPLQDLNIKLLDYSNATPGFPYVTRVRYCNNGNTIQNGNVEYNYESFLGFNNISSGLGSTLTLHDIPNNRFLWSFNNLLPGECRFLNVAFNVPVGTALGTNILGTASVDPVTGDVTPGDNVDTEQTVVVGSYDPNDKQVSLYRTGNAWDGGSIYETDNTLEYTVRFQNTGTAPAQFVIIRDTLDTNLLPHTVRELDSKHNMDVTLEGGNVLVFTFNNINLPDSSVSQEQSMGFVHFKIDRVAGLPVGTQISNQAAIYFDYNAPIYTNTPISIIDQYTTVVELEQEAFDVNVQPNPFERDLLVRYELKNNSDVQVKLYNQLGQCVYQEAYNQQTSGQQQVFLHTTKLTSGLYILQVETEEGSISKKLIKK